MKGLRRAAFIIMIFFLGVWFGNRQLPDWAQLALPVSIMWWLIMYDEVAYKRKKFEGR